MTSKEARDHHIVPQFFLRNFATDEARTRIATLAKEGQMAVWKERAIKSIGYERDFYVHLERGRPVSVENHINRTIETPISQSDTWAKIASDRSDALDRSDRAILYTLVRHLEARTPHFLTTGHELIALASNPQSGMTFTAEEQRMHAFLRANPDFAKFIFNRIASWPFDPSEFDSALILVARSPVPLRTSTSPAIAAPSPPHTAMDLSAPGTVPFQRILTVNPHTLVSVLVGDFGGEFANVEIDAPTAIGINRSFAAHFAFFPQVRHLVTGREQLIEDVIWAPYELVSDTPTKLVFKRTEAAETGA